MKIESLGGAAIISPPGAQSQAQKTAREKAIAILEGSSQNSPQTSLNQFARNEVSPQETQALNSAGLGQQNSNEAPPVPTESTEVSVESKEKAKADPLSSHYARLAKNEKILRQRAAEQRVREEALKAQELALKQREVDYQSKYVPIDRLKSDPLSVLSEQGLTYDQLTQLALNAPSPEAREADLRYKALEDKIAELTKGQEDSKKSYIEQQESAYKQAVGQIRQETLDLIRLQPDEYEAIKATNSESDVVALIERTWKRDQVLLSVDEAAREVENYLVEEATKISRLKKIQKRLAAQAAPSAKAPEVPKQGQSSLKTLTNNVGSTRQLTARERAMLAFRGELK